MINLMIEKKEDSKDDIMLDELKEQESLTNCLNKLEYFKSSLKNIELDINEPLTEVTMEDNYEMGSIHTQNDTVKTFHGLLEDIPINVQSLVGAMILSLNILSYYLIFLIFFRFRGNTWK